MPTPPQAPAKSAPFAKGSIIWERKGPLPVWAWALLLLGLVLAVTIWRRNKAAGEADESATGYTDELPGDQSAPMVFVVPQAPTPPVTVINQPPTTTPPAPPGGGREDPPGVPPRNPGPKAPDKPKPKPKSPGVTVPVVKFTTRNPPWNSTLSGIWSHYKTKTSAKNWQAVWNHPLNADLRRKRGAADRIQPGDKVFVPLKG